MRCASSESAKLRQQYQEPINWEAHHRHRQSRDSEPARATSVGHSDLLLAARTSVTMPPTKRLIVVEKPKVLTFLATRFTFLQLQTEDGMEVRPTSLATSPTPPHLEFPCGSPTLGTSAPSLPCGPGTTSSSSTLMIGERVADIVNSDL